MNAFVDVPIHGFEPPDRTLVALTCREGGRGAADWRMLDAVPASVERRPSDAQCDGAENVGTAAGHPRADGRLLAQDRMSHLRACKRIRRGPEGRRGGNRRSV